MVFDGILFPFLFLLSVFGVTKTVFLIMIIAYDEQVTNLAVVSCLNNIVEVFGLSISIIFCRYMYLFGQCYL